MEKFWIEKKGPLIIPPQPEHNHSWLHIPGIKAVCHHHKEDARYDGIKVFWEELGEETHLGYATNVYDIYKWNNWNIRMPVFTLYIYKPALKWPNVTTRLITGAWLHRKWPMRLVINLDKHPNFGTIGTQWNSSNK
jgi:hypothetical protein